MVKAVKGGSRTYFVEARIAKNGDSYLILSEKRKNDDSSSKILIFQESLPDLIKVLQSMESEMQLLQKKDPFDNSGKVETQDSLENIQF